MRNFLNRLAVLVASFIVCQSESNSGRFDDVKCEAQLKYFSESLSKRDSWALECKSGKNRSNSIFTSAIFSTLQCLIRGQNSKRGLRSTTWSTLVILSSASISNTSRVLRVSDWFKGSTVWFIIERWKMQGIMHQRLLQMEFLIGSKCEWLSSFN